MNNKTIEMLNEWKTFGWKIYSVVDYTCIQYFEVLIFKNGPWDSGYM